MKLLVLENRHFTCNGCTNCCRHWHVELLDEEITALPRLTWPSKDPLAGAPVTMKLGAKTVLRHKPDGACIYLNSTNGRCRIHEKFGIARKPLGCQLFPFHLAPTFAGQVSATPRYECPSVQADRGAAHASHKAELTHLSRQLRVAEAAPPADPTALAGLEPDQVQAIVDFAATLMNGFNPHRERALFLYVLAAWLAMHERENLDRQSLAEAYPLLRKTVTDLLAVPPRRPTAIARLIFQQLWALHLRRDEDIVDGRAWRLGRLWHISWFTLGRGTLRGLGNRHPAGSVNHAKLWRSPGSWSNPDDLAPIWRVISDKLLSGQFTGPANGNRDPIAGLTNLTQLFSLAAATARVIAAGQDRPQPNLQDAMAAAAAVEYAFGRSPLLASAAARGLEARLIATDGLLQILQWI